MKQKILFILLGSLLSLPAMARDFEYTYEDQTLTYTVIDEKTMTCEVKAEGCKPITGKLYIPEMANDGYDDYRVIAIGNYAFKNYQDMTFILIPNSVTSIGEGAFYECKGLTYIKIPNSVTKISKYCFGYCSNMTDIKLSNSVTEIESNAFESCSGLTSVEIPNSVTEIGTYAFYGCSGLTSVEIPNSVTYIGSGAFYNCKGLTYIKIPNSVTYISWYAFEDCSSLTSVEIPNTVTDIGKSAFCNCDLEEVILPPSVQYIDANAFQGNTWLKSIIMGHNVKTIGEEAFDGCPANTVSITAPTPPTAPNNTFSNYSGKLYLQGETAMKAYYDADTCWDSFNSYVMIDAEKINIYGADKISGKPGDTFQLTATVSPENATLPYVFWRSTNRKIATVDTNGLVTLQNPNNDGSCTIIAETLYYDGPVAQITVSNTGVNAVDSVAADGEGSIDYTRPYEVYNMSGLKVADSTEGLATGLYIIRQGNAAVKTAVR